MLLELTALSQVPRSHSVVQAASPQFCTVSANVYARRAVRVTLELSHKRLVLEIPNGNVAIATA